MSAAQLRHFDMLNPAEQKSAEDAIRNVLSQPQHRAWSQWERPELVYASARAFGLQLSEQDCQQILANLGQ
jgi:hypothetical protein